MWVQSACSHAALSTALTHSYPDLWTSCAGSTTPGYTGQAGAAGSGLGGHTAGPASSRQYQQHNKESVTGDSLRVGPGSLTAGVQVLPAEAGTHSVPDRAAGAGGAQAASPQLRPQIPALGGHVIKCSCASRPAWEPVPRSNGGSPVLPRQRSTCQGQ